MVSIAQNAKEGEMKKYIGIEDKKKSNPKKVAELKTTEQASHNSLFSKGLKKKGGDSGEQENGFWISISTTIPYISH